MKIVADDKIPFLRGAFEPFAEIVYLPGGKISAADLRDADALITRTRTICNAALLADSSVKFIATATIGFDHLDTAFLARQKIRWTNAPGCNAASVAQYIASALTDNNRLLAGKTLGIIGVGHVGTRVAAVGEALQMRVLRNDPPRARMEGGNGFVPIEQIIKEADFITLHVPLTHDGCDKTFHLVDAAFLRQMKHDAVLLNTSRGEVVNNVALRETLKRHEIGGAVLDVWENEPEIDRELLGLVQRGTPHIAGYSADGKANGTAMSVQSVAEFFDIEPLKNWRPAQIPPPAQPHIECPPGLSRAEIIAGACRAAYDIAEDDRMLRENPASFEALRGNYRIRREPPAFTVNPPLPELLQLGFRTP